MYINALKNLYVGDCAVGDREATPEEIAAWEAGRCLAEVEAKKAAIRVARKDVLNSLAGIAFAAQLSGDTDTTAAYLLVRQGLLDLTTNLPTDPALVDAEVMARYVAVRDLCTPGMVGAFAQVDA